MVCVYRLTTFERERRAKRAGGTKFSTEYRRRGRGGHGKSEGSARTHVIAHHHPGLHVETRLGGPASEEQRRPAVLLSGRRCAACFRNPMRFCLVRLLRMRRHPCIQRRGGGGPTRCPLASCPLSTYVERTAVTVSLVLTTAQGRRK